MWAAWSDIQTQDQRESEKKLSVAITLHQFLNPNTVSSQHINKLLLWLVHQKMKEANSDTFSVKYTWSFIACGRFLHCLNQKHPCFAKKDVLIVGSNRMKRRESFVKKESRMSFVLNQRVWIMFRLEVVTEARTHLSELSNLIRAISSSTSLIRWPMTVKPLWTPLLYLVLVRTEQFSEQRSKTMRGPKRFGQHSSLMQVFLQKSATRSAVRTISTVAR